MIPCFLQTSLQDNFRFESYSSIGSNNQKIRQWLNSFSQFLLELRHMEDGINPGSGRKFQFIGNLPDLLGYLKRAVISWGQFKVPTKSH
jgi:hypothetical protein